MILLEDFEEELLDQDAEELEPSVDEESLEEVENIPNEFAPTAIDIPDKNPISMKSPGQAKGLLDKIALKKLKLIKIKLAIGAGIIFLFLLFLNIMISKEVEVKYDYIVPTCSQISVHFLHRSEADLNLELENYVESMVYSLTKNIRNPKRVLYQTVAVAVRTNAQKLPSCTLNVSDEVDSYYTFEVLTSDNDRYAEISQAVEYVGGLVMVLNQQIMDVDFDSFCYRTKDEETYTIYNPYTGPIVPTEWVMEEVNNEYYRDCPCDPSARRSQYQANTCWVPERFPSKEDQEKGIVYYLYVDGGGSGKGLSVYTAHYLHSVRGYHDEDILRYFYPEKWEYYTVDVDKAKELDESGSLSCSYIDFGSTPLSRDEFISLAQSYLSGKSSQTAQLFRENAGLIYDLGGEIGANPEMVYIVAEKEQGWNDNSFTLRCNNFYGMGVSNGTSSGRCYTSFEDGVRGMLTYVKGKGNLDSFTKVYSYLGTYLANPGSAGDGGCYYLKLPDIYGPNYSRCNSGYSCSSSNGGAGCVLTTEAEKQAYIDWQASKILKIRSNIFNISAEDCSVSDSFGASVALGDAGSVGSSERMKWLFPNGVPKTKGEAEAYLTTISVPIVNTEGGRSSISLTVHKKLAKEIEAIFEEMASIGFPVHSASGYSYREMASGTGSLSHHSYGVAIDINASENPAVYQSGSVNKSSPYYINSRVVAIWKKHGFYWGGDWNSNYYDPMHFTYTNH